MTKQEQIDICTNCPLPACDPTSRFCPLKVAEKSGGVPTICDIDAVRERNRKAQRAYRERNKEKVARAKRAYRERNREKIAERKRLYGKRNRARLTEYQRRYRARKRAEAEGRSAGK